MITSPATTHPAPTDDRGLVAAGRTPLGPLARALVCLGLGVVLSGPFFALAVVGAIAATGCFMSCTDPNLPGAFAASWAAAAVLVGWARTVTWAFGLGEGRWSWRGALVAIAVIGTVWVTLVRLG